VIALGKGRGKRGKRLEIISLKKKEALNVPLLLKKRK